MGPAGQRRLRTGRSPPWRNGPRPCHHRGTGGHYGSRAGDDGWHRRYRQHRDRYGGGTVIQTEQDPFTIEIIKDALNAIGDEMFVSLQRTSMSPIIYEVLDYCCGITDSKGQLL